MFKSLMNLVLIDYWKFGKWSNMSLIQTWLLFFFSHGVLRVAYSTHVVNSESKSSKNFPEFNFRFFYCSTVWIISNIFHTHFYYYEWVILGKWAKKPNKCISQFLQDRNALKGAFRSLKFRGTMKLRGDRGDFQNQNKPCGSSRFLNTERYAHKLRRLKGTYTKGGYM